MCLRCVLGVSCRRRAAGVCVFVSVRMCGVGVFVCVGGVGGCESVCVGGWVWVLTNDEVFH